MSTDLCPDAVQAGFYIACQSAAFEEMQKIEDVPDMILDKVPLKQTMARYDNADTVITGRALQSKGNFRSLPSNSIANKPTVDGTMSAADCSNLTAQYETQVLDIGSGNCTANRCIVTSAQGYRTEGYFDREYEYQSHVLCIKDFETMPENTAREYFEQQVDDFIRHGKESYIQDVRNMAIVNSTANGTVLYEAPDQLNLASGGFFAPPTGRITIHYLMETRLHRVRIGAMGANEKLTVSGPAQDWEDAMIEHQAQRFKHLPIANANVKLEAMLFDDESGRMKKTSYYEYGNIRWVVDENPTYVWWKPNGVTPSGQVLYEMKEVERWVNQAQEVGVMAVPNPDYGKDHVYCDGIKYPVSVLLEALDSEQFSRHHLKMPIKQKGMEGMVLPYNFEIAVRGESYIPCNEYNEKFFLLARHRYRWRNIRREYGGFIAYRHYRPCGYGIQLCEKSCATGTPAFATVNTENNCPSQDCCTTPAVDAGLIKLSPCGTVETSYAGSVRKLRLKVERTRGSSGAATVAYSITAGAAISGTHYEDATTGGSPIRWADGEGGVKYIEINIIGGSDEEGTDLDFKVKLLSPTGASLADCFETTVVIETCGEGCTSCSGDAEPTP